MTKIPSITFASSPESAVVLKRYIRCFFKDEFPKYTHPVWRAMSRDLHDKWSPQAIYRDVRLNCAGIFSRVLRQMPVKLRYSTSAVTKAAQDAEGSSGSPDENSSDESTSLSDDDDDDEFVASRDRPRRTRHPQGARSLHQSLNDLERQVANSNVVVRSVLAKLKAAAKRTRQYRNMTRSREAQLKQLYCRLDAVNTYSHQKLTAMLKRSSNISMRLGVLLKLVRKIEMNAREVAFIHSAYLEIMEMSQAAAEPTEQSSPHGREPLLKEGLREEIAQSIADMGQSEKELAGLIKKFVSAKAGKRGNKRR